MLDSNFWNDSETANRLVGELKNIKNIVSNIEDLSSSIKGNLDIVETEEDDDILNMAEEEIPSICDKLDKLELETYLSGEYDNCNAIFEIHAGAGGTESCDWANMLYRMYTRYASNAGYTLVELDKQEGEEAGIKSVMFQINGNNAYGYLKREKEYIDLLELVHLMLVIEDILHLLQLMLCLRWTRILI